jgi:hypothetical protein
MRWQREKERDLVEHGSVRESQHISRLVAPAKRKKNSGLFWSVNLNDVQKMLLSRRG